MKKLRIFVEEKEYRLEITENCQMEDTSKWSIEVIEGVEDHYSLRLNALLDCEGKNIESMKFINFMSVDTVFSSTGTKNEDLIERVRLELLRNFIALNIIEL